MVLIGIIAGYISEKVTPTSNDEGLLTASSTLLQGQSLQKTRGHRALNGRFAELLT